MKKITLMCALVLLLAACAEPGGGPSGEGIVGTWGAGGVVFIQFTETEMLMSSPPATIHYGYSAAGGSGVYWDLMMPAATVPFTYSVNAVSLHITLNGTFTLDLERM
jgi:hypothetical protein